MCADARVIVCLTRASARNGILLLLANVVSTNDVSRMGKLYARHRALGNNACRALCDSRGQHSVDTLRLALVGIVE